MSCSQDQETVDLGEWIKGDKLSPLEVEVQDHEGNPYDLTGATAVELESVSLSRPTVKVVQPMTIFQNGPAVSPTAKTLVRAVDPAQNWTPAAGRTEEKFVALVKITKPAGPGWGKTEFALTFRTAP